MVRVSYAYQGRFPLQPYRSETYRISLFRERSGRTNDMGTIEYATFRYDTAEVENGLHTRIIRVSYVKIYTSGTVIMAYLNMVS